MGIDSKYEAFLSDLTALSLQYGVGIAADAVTGRPIICDVDRDDPYPCEYNMDENGFLTGYP